MSESRLTCLRVRDTIATTAEIVTVTGIEIEGTDGAPDPLTIDHRDATTKQTPTPLVETTALVKGKIGTAQGERIANGTETEVQDVVTMIAHPDGTVTFLMIVDEEAGLIVTVVDEKIETNSPRRLEAVRTVLHPRKGNPPPTLPTLSPYWSARED